MAASCIIALLASGALAMLVARQNANDRRACLANPEATEYIFEDNLKKRFFSQALVRAKRRNNLEPPRFFSEEETKY